MCERLSSTQFKKNKIKNNVVLHYFKYYIILNILNII